MRTAFLLVAGVMGLQAAGAPDASAQLASINGDAELNSNVSTIIALAPAPGSSATVLSSTVEEGASVDGSLYERSSGGVRLALAAGPGSDASITEATVCGDVHGDATLVSNIRIAAAVSLLAGGHTRITSASAGPGSQGPVSSFVSGGTVVATDFLPWGRSTIILGSTRRGC